MLFPALPWDVLWDLGGRRLSFKLGEPAGLSKATSVPVGARKFPCLQWRRGD